MGNAGAHGFLRHWHDLVGVEPMNVTAKMIAEGIAPVVKELLNKRDARIAELEGRIARLEKSMNGQQVAEWPLPQRKVG